MSKRQKKEEEEGEEQDDNDNSPPKWTAGSPWRRLARAGDGVSDTCGERLTY